MAKKRRKAAIAIDVKPIDVLATILDEIAEAVELMRPHFPSDDDETLRGRAMALRAERYQTGHWPDFEDVAKAEAAAEASADAAAQSAITEPQIE